MKDGVVCWKISGAMSNASLRKGKGSAEDMALDPGSKEEMADGGLLQLKTRTFHGVLVLAFTLVVSTVFVVISDDISVVHDVGLNMPRWYSTSRSRLSLGEHDFRSKLLRISLDPSESAALGLSWGDDASLLQGPDEAKGLASDLNQVGTLEQTGIPTPGLEGAGIAEPEPVNPWVQFPFVAVNETEHLMGALRGNGSQECHKVGTKTAQIRGLPQAEGAEQRIRLVAGHLYEVQIVSIGDDDKVRCAGGDYYETDLSSPRWKSRPPIFDHQNGSYSMQLQVDPRFAGVFQLKIILLFANFHGLHLHPKRWARLEQVANYEIEFVATEPKAPLPAELPTCSRSDFVDRRYWSGRWTREKENADCEYTRYGRFLCVDENLPCQEPWCHGIVGRLESNGWVYSAHCAFRILEKKEAWKCLDKKWLFFWGDSNHIDSIRNLLNFVLGFDHQVKFLQRRMDEVFYAPGSHNRTSVRITSMFNGHSNVTKNYEGLYSLHDPAYADQLRSFFNGSTAPDFMFMNSGLHDGVYWRDVERFMTEGVQYAADFWTGVWESMRARRPDILYRTTVTVGGNSRNMSFNPQKMELFNHLILDKFVRLNLERFQIIDGFDYTYPWHYDHKTNDGVHYGRPPTKSKWAGGNIGHQYFVDLMLVQMLLNAICPASS